MIGAPKRIFELMGGDLTISVHDDFLSIWHRRPATDLDELRSAQTELETLIENQSVHGIVFDSWDTIFDSEEIRAATWAWLTKSRLVRKVAILVQCQKRAGVLTELSRKKQTRTPIVKTFADESEAELWLSQPA